MRACRSRVTHPSAGRHQDVLLHPMLPLDLHVLSLPLAFILSQDQTLLCISFIFPEFAPVFSLKKLTLSIACTCLSFIIFNQLPFLGFFEQSLRRTYTVRTDITQFIPTNCSVSFSETGCKDTHFFIPSKFF